MKKNILSLILVFSVLFSFAQENSQQSSLLWEISGNGLEQPSYVFGTIHLIPTNDFFFPNSWEQKLISCKYLVLETDVKVSVAKQLSMFKKMKLPKDSSLLDYMSKEEQLAYQSYLLDSLGLSTNIYKTTLSYIPFVSYSLILNDLIQEKKETYEIYLSKLAKKNKIKLKSLETIDFQMSLVLDISIEKQLDMFLFDFGKVKQANIIDDYYEMVENYKNQDLEKIATKENSQEDEEFNKKFIYDRNRDWIPKIISFIKDKPTFIAVGAGHLPDEQGILQLLIDEGYTLTPVMQ